MDRKEFSEKVRRVLAIPSIVDWQVEEVMDATLKVAAAMFREKHQRMNIPVYATVADMLESLLTPTPSPTEEK